MACIVFDLNRFYNWFFKPCQNFPPRASHSRHFISQVRWFLIYYRFTSNGVLRGTQERISTTSSFSQSDFSLQVTAVRFASLSTSHRSNNSETKRADIANSRIDRWCCATDWFSSKICDVPFPCVIGCYSYGRSLREAAWSSGLSCKSASCSRKGSYHPYFREHPFGVEGFSKQMRS